jgi:hypothetical protein
MSMISPAIRIQELDDGQLEEFVDLWATQKSKLYVRVERVGGANDKGRDVIGFLTRRRHEGDWHLYQCKRKTVGSKLGLPEALLELGKVFYHHSEGAYATLPTKIVFVSPRGIVGSLMTLLQNPSTIAAALIGNWDNYCKSKITNVPVPLTDRLKVLIDGYDFANVEYLTAPMIVKDPDARPALVKVLGLVPEEAPPGAAPDSIQPEELEYVDQLRRVYAEAAGIDIKTADDILLHADHSQHFRDQRNRFFDAEFFQRFHRDSTPPEALAAFREDVYHGVIDVHRQRHPSRLDRLDAVMRHASTLPAGLIGRVVRVPVKQGMCHHLANEGRMKWTP